MRVVCTEDKPWCRSVFKQCWLSEGETEKSLVVILSLFPMRPLFLPWKKKRKEKREKDYFCLSVHMVVIKNIFNNIFYF
jgi:hypothetical protein